MEIIEWKFYTAEKKMQLQVVYKYKVQFWRVIVR
jgi:hypothetical protein